MFAKTNKEELAKRTDGMNFEIKTVAAHTRMLEHRFDEWSASINVKLKEFMDFYTAKVDRIYDELMVERRESRDYDRAQDRIRNERYEEARVEHRRHMDNVEGFLEAISLGLRR